MLVLKIPFLFGAVLVAGFSECLSSKQGNTNLSCYENKKKESFTSRALMPSKILDNFQNQIFVPRRQYSYCGPQYLFIHGGKDEIIKKPPGVIEKTLKLQCTSASEHTTDGIPKQRSQKRTLLALSYLSGMGICGVVLAALGSSLQDLAANCKTDAIQIGSVFVARGAGAIMGTISSAGLYRKFNGKVVMGTGLIFFAVALAFGPKITSVKTLHLLFFAFGICTAVVDTGCQILTRKLHGREAGPWLGANTVAFGLSGCMVPFIDYLCKSVDRSFTVLASLSAIVCVGVLAAPVPSQEEIPPPAVRPSSAGSSKKTYTKEMLIAMMALCLVGGKVTSTSYFNVYAAETAVIAKEHIPLLLMVLWGGVTVGRFTGIHNQRRFNLLSLQRHFKGFLVCGAVAMAIIAGLPKNSIILWVCVGLYGFFNGPTVGYSYDLTNRLTVPSEMGTSIVMLGLNIGASLVPFFTTHVWGVIGYTSLPLVLILSHLIPLFLLHVVCNPNVN